MRRDVARGPFTRKRSYTVSPCMAKAAGPWRAAKSSVPNRLLNTSLQLLEESACAGSYVERNLAH